VEIVLILIFLFGLTGLFKDNGRVNKAQELHEINYRQAVEDIKRWNRKHDKRQR